MSAYHDMGNCHVDVRKKKFTAWCEECDLVFDDPSLANEHQDKTKHRTKVTEYLITDYYYF